MSLRAQNKTFIVLLMSSAFPNVDGKIIEKVISYWKKHLEEGATDVQLTNFYQNFLKMSHLEFFYVHLTSRYLDDNYLEEVIIQQCFHRITRKTIEEIREVFNIVNNYISGEEEQVRRENVWDFKWFYSISVICLAISLFLISVSSVLCFSFLKKYYLALNDL